MKKTTAILFLLICMMLTLCACQKEANMVEDMVSTVFSDNSNANNQNSATMQNNNSDNNHNNGANGNNGTVTDSDGIIGNEDNTAVGENSRNNSDGIM